MKKYENFTKALSNLETIKDAPEPKNPIELSGMVALFEICFEQSWKAIKEILENAGYMDFKTGSPKQIIKTAYGAGLISSEETWIAALADRNNVAHSYNENIALSIIRHTREDYISMFKNLKDEIELNWL